jgi:hypothetical protein
MEENKPSNADLMRLADAIDKSTEAELRWVKNCVSVIAIILGLIISLKSDSANDICEYIAFISSVLFCGSCILCGLAFLYSETDTLYHQWCDYERYIQNKDNSTGTTLRKTARKPIYGKLLNAFFVLLALSILSLIVFAVFSGYHF